MIRSVLRLTNAKRLRPLQRLYSTNDIVEYQAPNESDYDKSNTHSDDKFLISLLLWPVGIWIAYNLLFIKRNSYSHKREFKLICHPFQSYLCKKYMTSLICQPYYRLLLKQSTPESQRVMKVLEVIVRTNNLNSLKDCKVLVYDLPNMFLHLSMDKKLIVSTKTLLLTQTDNELAFLIAHEIAHFLLDHNLMRVIKHWLNYKARLREKRLIQDSINNDFDKLAELNDLICYYPSYSLLDKFNERDTDILAHCLLEGCKEFNREKVFNSVL